MHYVVLLGPLDSDVLKIHTTSEAHVHMVAQDTYFRVYTHCKEVFTANKIHKALTDFELKPDPTKKPPNRVGGFYGLNILRKTSGQYEALSVAVESLDDEAVLVADDFVRIVGHADTAEAAEALAESGTRQTVWYIITHAKKFNPENELKPHHFSPAIQLWLASMPSSK